MKKITCVRGNMRAIENHSHFVPRMRGSHSEYLKRPLLVHITEDLKLGGQEKVIELLAKGLNPGKYRIEIWCIEKGGEIATALQREGVTVRILNLKTYHNPVNILYLAIKMKRAGVTMLHAHGYFSGTFSRLAGLISNVPIMFYHIHTTYDNLKKRNLLIERWLSKKTEKIICVSVAVKKFVKQKIQIDPEKLCTIYNGVSENHPKRVLHRDHGKDPDTGDADFIVASVGSLVSNKGHSVLIDAMTDICRDYPLVKLLIAGDGPLKCDLAELIKRNGMERNIFLLGQQHDVSTLLVRADIFVMPSIRREGLGLAIIEAMQAGLPVIASAIGGIPEVVHHGKNGLLIPAGDAAELSKAIMKLLKDVPLRESLGRAGCKIAKSRFSSKKMIAEIERLYDNRLQVNG